MANIFVTGADGFIGSHLVEALLAKEARVTALCYYNSMGSYGWLQHFAERPHKNLTLLLGDVRDRGFISQKMKGHDTVFHLASLIAIPYSYHAPASYIDTNVTGTLNVAQAAIENGVKKLIHTSTSEVYGTALRVPIDELHPLQGQSPYSASKIGADKIIESFCCSFDLPAVTLRPFNTFGPRQSLRAVIPTIISQILAGEKILHLGALKPTRDFNYVSDTVAAYLALWNMPIEKVYNQVFNTGTGREVSVADAAQTIARLITGKDVELVSEVERTRPANSEVERLLSDSSKLQKATDWRPLVSFEEGVSRMIEWMKKNQIHTPQALKYNI